MTFSLRIALRIRIGRQEARANCSRHDAGSIRNLQLDDLHAFFSALMFIIVSISKPTQSDLSSGVWRFQNPI